MRKTSRDRFVSDWFPSSPPGATKYFKEDLDELLREEREITRRRVADHLRAERDRLVKMLEDAANTNGYQGFCDEADVRRKLEKVNHALVTIELLEWMP